MDVFDSDQNRLASGIGSHSQCSLACPYWKVVTKFLVVCCLGPGSEVYRRLWRRASGDPAFYVVEDVVVKDDHPLSLFSSRNGASCRNVAHFVVDSAGFIRILLFVLTGRFGFRPADVGKVMLFVTF